MNYENIVPGAGIEPALGDNPNRILSPARLPVPPPGQYKIVFDLFERATIMSTVFLSPARLPDCLFIKVPVNIKLTDV